MALTGAHTSDGGGHVADHNLIDNALAAISTAGGTLVDNLDGTFTLTTAGTSTLTDNLDGTLTLVV